MTGDLADPYTRPNRVDPPGGSPAHRRKFMSFSTLRSRALLLVFVSLVVLGWTATGASTQGKLTGKVLPVISSSDVIGYTAPCG